MAQQLSSRVAGLGGEWLVVLGSRNCGAAAGHQSESRGGDDRTLSVLSSCFFLLSFIPCHCRGVLSSPLDCCTPHQVMLETGQDLSGISIALLQRLAQPEEALPALPGVSSSE